MARRRRRWHRARRWNSFRDRTLLPELLKTPGKSQTDDTDPPVHHGTGIVSLPGLGPDRQVRGTDLVDPVEGLTPWWTWILRLRDTRTRRE